ncbi:hypothetical protein GUITHDRAFT_161926 [Guillardia theta CCMP2712]|uniref:Uncharacterized protein n=1 Tax=Guillardia theta (strain CCMP2712) TaxID=905079 RepID=L1JPE4_GUITC|nr:hypothetical protein GUITHDRAFT_161926 [Guillardia theta CCMP2712]EKX50302.1 hypothetical protein GUITHDRAFT_161926 [Guillardia theta CCMP2712]|eukprot:XP_005837282.1 hypothetical protein GUITHDRAFT_161926 [Guillardia theta CCMP2712]
MAWERVSALLDETRRATEEATVAMKRLKDVNTSIIGFNAGMEKLLNGVVTAAVALDLDVSKNTQKAVQEKENRSLGSDELHDDVEQDDISETAAVKLPSSSQIQEFFKEKLPKKFHTTLHLKQLEMVLRKISESSNPMKASDIASKTGIGKVQIDEYLSALTKLGEVRRGRNVVRVKANGRAILYRSIQHTSKVKKSEIEPFLAVFLGILKH